MATFGSTINPSLGRTDYSAIQQGANAAAQGILAGGQGIARGIGQAGASIASGVEKHFKEQEQMKVMLGELDMIRRANPDAFKNVDPKIAERMAKGDIKFKEVAPLYAGVMTQQKLEQIQLQKKQQDFLNEIQKQEANARSLSALAAMRSAEASFAPKPTKPLRPMTLKEIADLGKQGVDVKAVPLEGGGWGAEAVSPFAPPSRTDINMPDPNSGKTYETLLDRQKIVQSAVSDTSNEEALKALASGKAFTGMAAEQKNFAAKALKALGSDVFDDEIKNTEMLNAMLVQPTIAIAKQLGANPSDKDAERIQKAQAGSIIFDEKTIKEFAEMRLRLKNNLEKSYNETIDEVYPDKEKNSKERAVLKIRKSLTPLSPAAMKYLPPGS